MKKQFYRNNNDPTPFKNLARKGVRFVRHGKQRVVDIRYKIKIIESPHLAARPAWSVLGNRWPDSCIDGSGL